MSNYPVFTTTSTILEKKFFKSILQLLKFKKPSVRYLSKESAKRVSFFSIRFDLLAGVADPRSLNTDPEPLFLKVGSGSGSHDSDTAFSKKYGKSSF
jgi:hypothetical protein